MAGTFEAPEVVYEELDILLVGGGMACCGTAYEMMRWAEALKAETGKELKIKLVDKAAMDRSGAVAQGLSAINTYIDGYNEHAQPFTWTKTADQIISSIKRKRIKTTQH